MYMDIAMHFYLFYGYMLYDMMDAWIFFMKCMDGPRFMMLYDKILTMHMDGYGCLWDVCL